MSDFSLIQLDGILNLVCAISMSLAIGFQIKSRSATLAEKRLSLLLFVVLLITGSRAYSYLVPSSMDVSPLLMYFASFFPIAVVLLSEGMVRRHAPIALKMSGVIGTVASLACLIILGASNPLSLWVLIVSQVCAVVALIYMGAVRKRAELSPDEEQLIRLLLVSAAFSIPLIVTDFRNLFDWDFPRMGALAPMLVLSAVQASLRHESTVTFVTRLMVHSGLVIGFCIFFFPNQWIALSSFVLALILLGRNIERFLLKDPHGLNFDFWQAYRGSVQAKKSDIGSLQKALEGQRILLWQANDFAGYDTEMISQYLSQVDRMTLAEARLQSKKTQDQDVSEQIVDLLESNEMNLLVLVQKSPLTVMMANVPVTLGTRPLELETLATQALIATEGKRN